MSDPRVEDQLRDFLRWEDERRRKGLSIEALHQKVDQLSATLRRVSDQQLATDQKTARYGRRLRNVESQVSVITRVSPNVTDWDADPAEITGTHQFAIAQRSIRNRERLEELEAQEAKRAEHATWWQRQKTVVLMSVAGALIVAAVSGCVSFAMTHLSAATSQPGK